MRKFSNWLKSNPSVKYKLAFAGKFDCDEADANVTTDYSIFDGALSFEFTGSSLWITFPQNLHNDDGILPYVVLPRNPYHYGGQLRVYHFGFNSLPNLMSIALSDGTGPLTWADDRFIMEHLLIFVPA